MRWVILQPNLSGGGAQRLHLYIASTWLVQGFEVDNIFNHGSHERSFSYVDGIVEGVTRVFDKAVRPNASWNGILSAATTSLAPFRPCNAAKEQPAELSRYIEMLEKYLGRKAQVKTLPVQMGDVPDTEADASGLIATVDLQPKVPVEVGVANFVKWHCDYLSA